MTDLKKMTVAASGKLRQVAYDILNEQTRLLSWQQGGKVPQEQSARFINISRGRVVETQALYEALRSGQIAYAAIDVVEPEPLPGDHPLLTLSNITVTPHIAASTVETRDAMAKLAAANILAGLAGDPLPAQVQIKD